VTDPDDEAGAAPKLNVAANDKALRRLDCVGIVDAIQRLEGNIEAILANGVGPIFCHHLRSLAPGLAQSGLGVHRNLLSERSVYMTKCKRIREVMAGDYDTAADKGVSKKLLKVIIAERKDERTIAARRANLEQDEVSEFDMLCEKLGDYANTPLGGARARQGQRAVDPRGNNQRPPYRPWSGLQRKDTRRSAWGIRSAVPRNGD